MRTVALAALATLAQTALADSTIGLNFCDNWPAPRVSDGTADGFAGWTDSRAEGDTTNGAVQATPLALRTSGVTVTWTAANTWSAGAESTNEQALYRVYLDDGQTSAGVGVRVTISGLSGWLTRGGSASYRLRCYANNDGANTFQPISVRNGATTTSPVLQTITPVAKGNGSYPTSGTVGTGESRGYGDSPATLAADTITLTIPPRSGSSRGTLCAFKITASAAPPVATSLAATGVTDTTASLNGTVNANDLSTAVTFEYGLTLSYGSTVAAVPATVTGATGMAVSAALADLVANTTYHYRVAATSSAGTSYGLDRTFTTGNAVFLTGLTPSAGTLTPAFSKTVTSYALQVPSATTSIQVTPVAEDAGSTIRVQGNPLASGAASAPIALAVGNTVITTAVTAAGGSFAKNYVVTVTRYPETYVFHSATPVLVTAPAFNATGNISAFALNFAPTAGTNLMVVNNTGLGTIVGTFDNLAQGQRVDLTYGGITYPFVANYFGGTGNDLVLQWASNRLLAWGSNYYGQLGLNHPLQTLVPTAVLTSGVLAGKVILRAAVGSGHTLALCADGTLAAWGDNSSGQLGNNNPAQANTASLVDQTGVLAGKTVVAIAAGTTHSLALCSDGTLASWGDNSYGQLGTSSTPQSDTPVRVNMSGVLSGKTVVAISAGYYFCLALCADGTLAAWGDNIVGQLGNQSTTQSMVPVLVDRTGVLSGKTVTAIAAGGFHSMALSADGTMAAWGANSYGQLGNNSTTNRLVPESMDRTGVLAGKSIVAMAGGTYHTVVLCSDGSLVAAGKGDNGGLGNGGGNSVNTSPVLVTRTGVLSGKTINAVSTGAEHCLVVGNDGTLATWGYNYNGQLGNNSTAIGSVPVMVNTSALRAGERLMAGISGTGANHNLALVASVPAPLATTLAATGISDTGGILKARVNANGTSATVTFEYGLTTAYGATVTASPTTVTGTSPTQTSATLSSLLSGFTYHYRVVATSNGGTVMGEDMTFTTSTLSGLASLAVSSGSLAPTFSLAQTSYFVTVPNETSSLNVTPLAVSATAAIKINNVTVASGSPSGPISLAVGNTTITTVVTAAGGSPTKTYTMIVTRLPAAFTFSSATTVPVTVSSGFGAAGNAPAISLTFAPATGTNLTVVKNTGNQPIQGCFENLAQGQSVYLTFGGTTYGFVANYFGGTGNDLVLHWANNRLMVWGRLGSAYNQVPVPVSMTGILSEKTIISTANGSYHNLALCSDGTLAAWGNNSGGQLGNGSTTSNEVPVAVDRTGVLAGKTIMAICSGYAHGLALCTDGTLAAWGDNSSGQLGDNTYVNALLPVLVNRTGVLAGKTVIAIAAGRSHSLALCSDGTVAAWGANSYGQLGNGTTGISPLPVMVSRTGGLAGKTVTSIATGTYFSMAVCSDGTAATWGDNSYGQLGNNTTIHSSVPVAVTKTGVLAGKTIMTACAGYSHSLALCSDGTLGAWGSSYSGQLGNGSTDSSNAPVLVNRSGALAGKTVTGISAGISHGLAVCADGTLAAWGSNGYGELGDNSKIPSSLPVLSSTSSLRTDERFVRATSGDSYDYVHCIGIVASPPRPAATTLAATAIAETGATLNASVISNGTTCNLSFQYGLTQAYGTTVTATPPSVSGADATAVSAWIEGLTFGTTYHYRVVATNANDTGVGDDMTFTTAALATLSGLSLSQGSLVPAFSPVRVDYYATVPFATANLTVTPVATDGDSTVQVNGVAVAAGEASHEIGLSVGTTVIRTLVTGAAPGDTKTYTVAVTRLPEVLAFRSAAEVPVTVGDFAATGYAPGFALGFAPVPGTSLMVVRKSGISPIHGVFDNLAQGQLVRLTYGGVTYPFVANYRGGTGNDLVLQWANTRVMSWGNNSRGQLGDGSKVNRQVPGPIDLTGVLAGQTVIDIATCSVGNGATLNAHNLVLCADGKVVAWGENGSGQLGNGGTTNSSVPVGVDQTGVLAGRTVVSIAAGGNHSLALCSDGRVASWGDNAAGQLGCGNQMQNNRPVLVDNTGVLAGKTVVAIAAGSVHSLALCADGTLASWGVGGRLGNNSSATSPKPVAVDQSGVLFGKAVVAIATGSFHSLALCADGTLAAWGYNSSGQLGNNSTTNAIAPVLVNRSNVLSGKTVTAITGGQTHSLVACADGSLAAWGQNSYGQLGSGIAASSNVPVRVMESSALVGKTVTAISGGGFHSLALAGDGTLAAWGANSYGQAGHNATVVGPVRVDVSTLISGERFVAASGSNYHSLALTSLPPPPDAITLAASGLSATGATLNGSVHAGGVTTTVSFEYGLTSAYGSTVAATPATATGNFATAVARPLSGLVAGAIYHYRVVASNPNGTSWGDDMTFTPSQPPAFAGFTVSTPWQTAATIALRKILAKASDPDGDLVTITGAGTASAQGGSAVLQGLGILYTPRAGFSGTDSFPVTLTDAGGASAIGTVTVTVGAAPSASGSMTQNPPVLTSLPGGKMGIAFHGIPGRSYVIQRSTNGLDNWATLATVTADASGMVSFTDPSPPVGSAFYRLGLP